MLCCRVRLRAASLPEDSAGRFLRASLSSSTRAALWWSDLSLRSEQEKNAPALGFSSTLAPSSGDSWTARELDLCLVQTKTSCESPYLGLSLAGAEPCLGALLHDGALLWRHLDRNRVRLMPGEDQGSPRVVCTSGRALSARTRAPPLETSFSPVRGESIGGTWTGERVKVIF